MIRWLDSNDPKIRYGLVHQSPLGSSLMSRERESGVRDGVWEREIVGRERQREEHNNLDNATLQMFFLVCS